MMTRFNRYALTAAAALLALSAVPAQAQLLNPGFETGTFANWMTIGSTAVVGSVGAMAPDSGSFQARINTQPGAVPPAAVEGFLGLMPGKINAMMAGGATQGSAIKQTITVLAGDVVNIRYNYITTEFTPEPFFNDTAFFSVVGPGVNVCVKVADTLSAPFSPASGGFNDQTTYRTFSYTFLVAGTFTVGIGIVDRNDMLMVSALLVDTAGAPPAPGVTIVESGGSTNVTEGGATDTYTVVLKSAPTANVTITLNPGTQVTVAPAALTFTPANWNVAQTVTVTAVDDLIVEGPHTGTITHTAASADAAYNGIAIANVIANITDNDVGPPPPPPAPPAPPQAPGEGTYAGVGGPAGAGEGMFGYGFGMKAVKGPPLPVLNGPVADPAGGHSGLVFNVSQNRPSNAASTTSSAKSALGPTLLAGLALGLIAIVLLKLKPA